MKVVEDSTLKSNKLGVFLLSVASIGNQGNVRYTRFARKLAAFSIKLIVGRDGIGPSGPRMGHLTELLKKGLV